MQKKSHYLIYIIILTISSLFGADQSYWPAHFDAYQTTQIVYHSDHKFRLYDAIKGNASNDFHAYLNEINDIKPIDIQRDILNQPYSNVTPHVNAYNSSCDAARKVIASEDTYSKLKIEINDYGKKKLMYGAAIGTTIATLYGLYSISSTQELMIKSLLGGVAGSGLGYLVTKLRYHKQMKGAEDKTKVARAAFESSKAIYSTLVNHDYIDIINSNIRYDKTKDSKSPLQKLLNPIFEETAQATKRRFPINNELVHAVRDEQIDNQTKLKRLHRLNNIFNFYETLQRNIDSEDERLDKYLCPHYTVRKALDHAIGEEEKIRAEQEQKKQEAQAMIRKQQEIVSRIKNTDNHYKVLGVPQSASQNDILKAFREISKLVHPDKNNDIEKAVCQKVTEAKTILSDSETRKEYNAKLESHKDRRKLVRMVLKNEYIKNYISSQKLCLPTDLSDVYQKMFPSSVLPKVLELSSQEVDHARTKARNFIVTMKDQLKGTVMHFIQKEMIEQYAYPPKSRTTEELAHYIYPKVLLKPVDNNEIKLLIHILLMQLIEENIGEQKHIFKNFFDNAIHIALNPANAELKSQLQHDGVCLREHAGECNEINHTFHFGYKRPRICICKNCTHFTSIIQRMNCSGGLRVLPMNYFQSSCKKLQHN